MVENFIRISPQIIAFPNTAEIWPCFCKEMQKVWRIKSDPPKIWWIDQKWQSLVGKTAGYEIFSPRILVRRNVSLNQIINHNGADDDNHGNVKCEEDKETNSK